MFQKLAIILAKIGLNPRQLGMQYTPGTQEILVSFPHNIYHALLFTPVPWMTSEFKLLTVNNKNTEIALKKMQHNMKASLQLGD